ncbi:MAG: hypothetical protein GY822_29450 [Deltaproteobacteria bacterium]|nr:hypothetical protein [Deltaproteobacteria bacterium]
MPQEALVVVIVGVVVFLARNFLVRQEKQEALPEVEISARIVDDNAAEGKVASETKKLEG